MQILSDRRILICGKGGSGKSSVSALMARALANRHYNVLLLDGDASNPGGLVRLVLGTHEGPAPLIEFFGGRERVTCPVDDPSPLTRVSDSLPVAATHLALQEIPPQFYVRSGNVLLFQVGKIHTPYEGCDGPMSKVTRDFVLSGNYVTVIDTEAGIEHFGRGVEKHIDIVLVVVDPTFESFEIAARVTQLCSLMSITRVFAILNRVDSTDTESVMRRALATRHAPVLGCVSHDLAIRSAGMNGEPLSRCTAAEEVAVLVERLENILHANPETEGQ